MYSIKKEWELISKLNKKEYNDKYLNSVQNNEIFWSEEGKRIDWIKEYTKIKKIKYSKNEVDIKWYYDGTLNASYNCIDRHAKISPDKPAIIWESDDPNFSKTITYKDLLREVSKASHVLKNLGVKKGDRVTIYLTMIPELAYFMLACSRIGAVHSIIFGGFSSESIKNRIIDCKSEFIITADEGIRGGKKIPLKQITDQAIKDISIKKKN